MEFQQFDGQNAEPSIFSKMAKKWVRFKEAEEKGVNSRGASDEWRCYHFFSGRRLRFS
jgi:hypothetical protein